MFPLFLPSPPPPSPKGSVYKKANPQKEINTKTRDAFWSKQEVSSLSLPPSLSLSSSLPPSLSLSVLGTAAISFYGNLLLLPVSLLYI